MNQEILQLLRPALAWAWLVAWLAVAPNASCPVTLAFLFPAVLLIAWNILEPKVLARRAFVHHYLVPGRLLSRLLGRHLLLTLWSILKSMVLAVLLLLTVLRWPGWVLLLLAADVPVILLLYRLLGRFFAAQARPGVARVLARRVLVWVNALVLAGALVGGELVSAHPDYRTLGWQATLERALEPVQLGCGLLAPLARLTAGQEALSWRLMQLGVEQVPERTLALLAWVLFLGASTLALWAWSRLLSGSLLDGDGLRLLAGRWRDGR